MLLPEWSTAVFLFSGSCSWVPCLSWTVKLPAVHQKNPSGPTNSFVFQHLLHIWTLSNNDCIILRSIFSHWGQLRDSYYTKGSNRHWCSRRYNNALRAGGWKLLNKMKMYTFFLFYLNIFFSPLVLPFRSYRRYLHVSQNTIYPDLQVQIQALNSMFPSKASVSVWTFCNSCNSPSVVLSVKRWISKLYSHCWKGFNYAKQDAGKLCGSWRIFTEQQRAV